MKKFISKQYKSKNSKTLHETVKSFGTFMLLHEKPTLYVAIYIDNCNGWIYIAILDLFGDNHDLCYYPLSVNSNLTFF